MRTCMLSWSLRAWATFCGWWRFHVSHCTAHWYGTPTMDGQKYFAGIIWISIQMPGGARYWMAWNSSLRKLVGIYGLVPLSQILQCILDDEPNIGNSTDAHFELVLRLWRIASSCAFAIVRKPTVVWILICATRDNAKATTLYVPDTCRMPEVNCLI